MSQTLPTPTPYTEREIEAQGEDGTSLGSESDQAIHFHLPSITSIRDCYLQPVTPVYSTTLALRTQASSTGVSNLWSATQFCK